jgi:hypothetical protein
MNSTQTSYSGIPLLGRGFPVVLCYTLTHGNSSTYIAMNKPRCHIIQYIDIHNTKEGVAYGNQAARQDRGLPLDSTKTCIRADALPQNEQILSLLNFSSINFKIL